MAEVWKPYLTGRLRIRAPYRISGGGAGGGAGVRGVGSSNSGRSGEGVCDEAPGLVDLFGVRACSGRGSGEGMKSGGGSGGGA